MVKKKSVERFALDEKEIAGKHFFRLRKLLQEEQRRDREQFKSQVLDKKPEDREKGGKALLRLSLIDSRYNASGQRLLSFSNPNKKSLPRYGIQVGDVIRLSGFQTPQAERPTGTVYEKDRFSITVAFSHNLPGWIGSDKFYHLNISEHQTTYDRMHEAITLVAGASHTKVSFIRDISLGLRDPRFGDPVPPKSLKYFNPKLNELQKKAVCKAFEAEDVFLIHGPPGTGKTSVLVEIIAQAKKQGQAVLVSAPSNAACDHMVAHLVGQGIPATRLGNPARMVEHLREHTLSFKISRHPFAKMINDHEARLDQLFRQKERRKDRRVMSWDEKRQMREEVNKIRADIRSLRHEMFQQIWKASDIVVATHTVCGDPIIRGKAFDWVIVDEATQGVEPATWIPASHCGKLILAGDHFQLPPTVMSPKRGPGTLNFTLFERFYEKLGDESKIRLETQYRMNEKIMNFSSREFYGNKLTAHTSVRDYLLSGLSKVKESDLTKDPVVFLDTAGCGYEEKVEPGSESRLNPEEAGLVVSEVRRLIDAGVKETDIAVISPYSAQVKHLLMLLQKDEWDAERGIGPEIDSIDAFQGREKEVVIVSLVRSNLTGRIGFLGDTRRMNVAMTRAKRKLIVIGDSATISSLPFYEDFLKYVETEGAYHSAWEYVS